MQDNWLIEIFDRNYVFLDKAIIPAQKFEFDYMSNVNNKIKVSKRIVAERNAYIRFFIDRQEVQGVITSVKYVDLETEIEYKSLLNLFDVDIYKNRNDLSNMSIEGFVGAMISECYINNADQFQNIPGLYVKEVSRTENGKLNLKDNIHNISDVIISAFKKYEIVVDLHFDVMKKNMGCIIGKREYEKKTIECDLKNILESSILIKDNRDAVNKVLVVGEYPEESSLYGKVLQRVFFQDKNTGEITEKPSARILPVVFRCKVIKINPETFEEDAYQEAYNLIYQKKYDNSIKVKVKKNDNLYRADGFQIGQNCSVIKDKTIYETVYTGCTVDKNIITFLFGTVRTEFTKNKGRR